MSENENTNQQEIKNNNKAFYIRYIIALIVCIAVSTAYWFVIYEILEIRDGTTVMVSNILMLVVIILLWKVITKEKKIKTNIS